MGRVEGADGPGILSPSPYPSRSDKGLDQDTAVPPVSHTKSAGRTCRYQWQSVHGIDVLAGDRLSERS